MTDKQDTDSTNIDYIPSEQEDYYSDDSLYNINSWGADLSFRELVDRYNEGEILKPEMQRNYVWDKTEASRFIDSILLGLPVPSIFLAKPKITEEELLIVDGYQRIMTVHDYMHGVFQKDGKTFALTNSDKINDKWRGKTFIQLSENERRKIRNTTIHSIIFVQIKPQDDTSFYQIFERINTSGRTLTPQEIRNCVYLGKFNTLLIKLNKYNKWRVLFGTAEPHSRMQDIEYILRFFAIASVNWSDQGSGMISLKKFLNEYMGSAESKEKNVLDKREDNFKKVVDFLYDYLGETAFRNLSEKTGKYTRKFNPTIYDSIMTATDIALRSKCGVDVETLKERKLALLSDEEYQEFISVKTTNRDRIAGRISLALKYLYDLSYE